jgi:hypothetical protein
MVTVHRALLVLGAVMLSAGPARAQRRPITAEEIQRAGSSVSSAFDAVERLRPRWLQPPREQMEPSGASQDAAVRLAQLHVYQEDRDMGSVDYLKTIPAERIFTISWLSMTEAGVRFGPSEGPVLVVKMKPAGPN